MVKSFEWIEIDEDNVVITVQMTGLLSLHYTRLDLASRGLTTDGDTEYITPFGKIFLFPQ